MNSHKLLTIGMVIAMSVIGCTGSGESVRMPGESFRILSKADVDRIFNERIPWVEKTFARLTLEEKVGQLLAPRAFAHYLSSDAEEYREMIRCIRELKVGGLVFFQGDVSEMVLRANEAQQFSDVPLLLSADFEWGPGMRVRRSTSFPPAMALGATRDAGLVYRIGRAVAAEGTALGIQQNFAPVTEPNLNPKNPVINFRSFGEAKDLVAELATAYMLGLQDGGMIATAKHFPGHGATETDSHMRLPILTYNREDLETEELYTFRRTIEKGVLSVMTAHIALPLISAEPDRPATLSREIVTGILREDMGFSGLIVSDALEMRAITANFSPGEAAVLAVEAGVDMLLLPQDMNSAYYAILEAVRSGRLNESRIDDSVRRILTMKYISGLHLNRFVGTDKFRQVVANREHADLALEAARKSITLVRNDGDVLPLQPTSEKKVLVVVISDREDLRVNVGRSRVVQPNEPVGQYFSQLLRGYHTNVETIRLDPRSNRIEFDTLSQRAMESDVVIAVSYVQARSYQGEIGIPEQMHAALQHIIDMDQPFILVSLGDPYFIYNFPDVDAYLTAYHSAEPSVEAVVETIFGKNIPTGKLPVSIPGVAAAGAGLTYEKAVPAPLQPERDVAEPTGINEGE